MFSFIPYNNGMYPYYVPFIPANCDKPPTIYEILNSIVNGTKDKEEYTKIKDLAKNGRQTIFNFDYPLSSNVSRETFETTILNHYMMRRIGYDTVTAFRIALSSKLEEIMPMYNKMFDALENWNIFEDGDITTRSATDNRTTTNTSTSNTSNDSTSSNTLSNTASNTTTNTTDSRNSDLPQNQLDDVRNGSYVTDYKYDTNNATSNDKSDSAGSSTTKANGTEKSNSNGTDNVVSEETIKRSPADKIVILREMQENIKSIYTLIFNDLDVLFYNLL